MAAPSAEIAVHGAGIEFYVFCKTFLDIRIHFQEILNFRRVLCSTSPQRAEGKLNAVKLVELYHFYFNLTVLILVKVGKVLD